MSRFANTEEMREREVGADGIAENGTPLKASAKKGDTVIYKKWGGNDVKIGDKEYQFLKFDDVLAVVSSK
jgi:chaperonin GroES